MPDTLITDLYSAAGTPLEMWAYDFTVDPDADPRTCSYTHFNLSSEQLGRTARYNCWGFTFVPRRYWMTRTSVNTLLAENCSPVADGSIQVGDVIRYQLNNVTTHTGRVWQTDGAGHATLIRSKWGGWAEYIHAPLDVPESYGTQLAYFRQHSPLRGQEGVANRIADLWIRDSPADNGQQGRRAPWWTSPDILVDAFPFDGNPDVNPVYDHPNRIWAVVRNRTNQRVDNVYVRFYWADPSTGLPAASWNLIPSIPGHANPVGPLSINPNASVETGYVEWTPSAAPSHQCLLAIAYVNDDPRDVNNPDPLVYPFDIPFDNNIAQRNVELVELPAGGNGGFAIYVTHPFLQVEQPKETFGSLHAVLTSASRLPLVGIARLAPLPRVTMELEEVRPRALKPLTAAAEIKVGELRDKLALHERVVAGLDIAKVPLVPGKRRLLKVNITAPKEARPHSMYYLHIFQKIGGVITGGYTAMVVVK